MNPFANHISDRALRVWTIIWAVVFVGSGLFITWFGWHHTTGGNENAVVASSPPACRNNAVIVRHNQYPSCDLSHGGILIELGTTRSECADAGGRFMRLSDRRFCVGEDI